MKSISVRYEGEEENIRFGCSWNAFNTFRSIVERTLPPGPLLADLGSGDFHHISYLLLERLPTDKKYHVVVFDNHPDNMRFPFGIHCGSWVYHAAKLSHVSHITVVGITSGDVRGFHLLENHWSSIIQKKLTYLCAAPFTGISGIAKDLFPQTFREVVVSADLVSEILKIDPNPIYLSIDKDVLSKEEIMTNWDQGVMTRECLLSIVQGLSDKVVAGDITGDISFYEYKTWWKRMLSSLDGQEPIDTAALPGYKESHAQLNAQIASILKAS